MFENERFYLFDLQTKTTSKKSWKTYKRALQNASGTQIVSTLDGINWALQHPDWIEKRLGHVS